MVINFWVMTNRTRSRIQVAKMSFLRRVAGRSVRDRVGSSVTREELGVETLLLSIERSQLRWLIDFIVLINVIHFLMIDSFFF